MGCSLGITGFLLTGCPFCCQSDNKENSQQQQPTKHTSSLPNFSTNFLSKTANYLSDAMTAQVIAIAQCLSLCCKSEKN